MDEGTPTVYLRCHVTAQADMQTARTDSIDSTATTRPSPAITATKQTPPTAPPPSPLQEKRRLLLLVRTGLTLAIGYLIVFSDATPWTHAWHLVFVAGYLGTNLIIARLPDRLLGHAVFDGSVVMFDTAAISLALYVLPQTDTDVFVFYFVVILLASITDRFALSLLAPVITSIAYLGYLFARYETAVVLQPSILLRVPFFLLAGAFYGFFIDRDRRGRIATAAASERELARTEFLALVTHDFKQPLWVAQQAASLLFEKLDAKDGEARTLLGQVMFNLRRIEALTQNFLDLHRIESRGIRLFLHAASLNRLVIDLVETYRPVFAHRSLGLKVELDRSVPPMMFDPQQLERALANLLDNAVKYTPEGGEIVCRTRAHGAHASVIIGDSGPGISPDRVATLFSRFQTGTDTAERRSSGLGLFITRSIVAAHGGEITLDRSQPQGAWFVVELPVSGPATS